MRPCCHAWHGQLLTTPTLPRRDDCCTVGTDATEDGVVEVLVNKKMRAVRCCKDKTGTVSAARLVYIGLGHDEPTTTVSMLWV